MKQLAEAIQEVELADVSLEQLQAASPLDLVALEGLFGLASNPYAIYANNPAGFSREVLGNALTDGQEAVLQSVVENKITVVMSANDVGKTFVGADIAVWFTRCLERSKVITGAAPPLDNLQRLLWGEIDRRLLDRPEIVEDGKHSRLHFSFAPDWWCDGVAIPVAGSAAEREAKFSGKHAPYLLFIMDEADAIPAEVYRGIESCMSGGFVRLICFFNPREQAGPVVKLMNEGANVIELDAFSHPNVTSGKDLIPGAVSREITIERILKWTRPAVDGEAISESNPEFFQVPEFLGGLRVRLSDGTRADPLIPGQWRKVSDPQFSYMVLARFPGHAINQLISRTWVQAAFDRWRLRDERLGSTPPEGVSPIYGLDVAEFGADFNSFCVRYGGWVRGFDRWNGIDPHETAQRAAEMVRDEDVPSAVVNVDTIGIGAAVPSAMGEWWSRPENDALDEDGHSPYSAYGVKVSAKATVTRPDETEFYSLREQLYWAVSQWLRADPTAMLPPNDSLMEELTAIRYSYDLGGRVKINAKDKMRAALGRSPDDADALALTFADAEGEILMAWG